MSAKDGDQKILYGTQLYGCECVCTRFFPVFFIMISILADCKDFIYILCSNIHNFYIFIMRIVIYICSSSKDSLYQSLINEYFKRIKNSVTIKEIIIKKKLPAELAKQEEAKLLMPLIDKNSYLIALDERGGNLTSPDFAQALQELDNNGIKEVVFVIGGAYGLDNTILKKANLSISFGKMVWPHQMVKLMLVEQIYRAQTIQTNHPYHKE